jgi:hypothetical protein
MHQSFATAMVFQAPGASVEGFQRHLIQKNQQSYTQWFQQKSLSSPQDPHPKVLEFVQQALENEVPKPEASQNSWERLRTATELNAEDRELLVLLAEKRKNTLELCRGLLLAPRLQKNLESPNVGRSCQAVSEAMPATLLNLLASDDLLSIDGNLFRSEQVPKRIVPGVYRWKLLSNQFSDREYVGTASDFAKAAETANPWVEGTCQNAKLRHGDFEVLTQAKIYFTDECESPGIPLTRDFGTWASEHEKIFWAVGLFLVGAAAYQLRDKNLIVSSP